jgi:hypothetical protein
VDERRYIKTEHAQEVRMETEGEGFTFSRMTSGPQGYPYLLIANVLRDETVAVDGHPSEIWVVVEVVKSNPARKRRRQRVKIAGRQSMTFPCISSHPREYPADHPLQPKTNPLPSSLRIMITLLQLVAGRKEPLRILRSQEPARQAVKSHLLYPPQAS